MNGWNLYESSKNQLENLEAYLVSDGKVVGFGYFDNIEFVGYVGFKICKIKYWMPLPKPPENDQLYAINKKNSQVNFCPVCGYEAKMKIEKKYEKD